MMPRFSSRERYSTPRDAEKFFVSKKFALAISERLIAITTRRKMTSRKTN
jgi:hypothetical protein